jgi:hypothetical protein
LAGVYQKRTAGTRETYGIDYTVARTIPTIYAEEGRQAEKDRDRDDVHMFGKNMRARAWKMQQTCHRS